MHTKWHHGVNHRFASFLFRFPFANCASVSGDPYIDFDQNHLIFPEAYLVCEIDALFIFSLPEHAYALHITFRISCHVLHHVACAFPVIDCWSFACVLALVEPGDKNAYEEPVENAYVDQAFDNSENLAGKMTIPSKSLLSLLASCSLYRYAALPTTCYIMPPMLPCQAFNHPFLANRCLAKLPLLLSPYYSIASCR